MHGGDRDDGRLRNDGDRMRSMVTRYLRGDVELGRVFWFDMLLVGTIVNLVAGAAALVIYANYASGWLALAVLLSPAPYNIGLCVSVWRSAAKSGSRWADVARFSALLWLIVVFAV